MLRISIAAFLLSGCTTLDVQETDRAFVVKAGEGKTTKYEIWFSCEARF